MSEEKVDRNAKIYCEKLGLDKPNGERVNKPLSYTELVLKYKLSSVRLQQIVNRERKKWKKQGQ